MSIKLKGSSDGSVSFDAPADTSPSGSDITLTLPTSAGSADQFLKNSGIAGELEYSSMVENSSGNVGIGTTNPLGDLSVSNGGASGIELQPEITTNTNRITNYNRSASSYNNFRLDAAQQEFLISGTEKARLDSSGRLLVGTSSNFVRGNIQAVDNGGGEITIGRSDTSVTNGNDIGHLFFCANDSDPGALVVANISCFSEADYSSGSAPANLRFSVCEGGSTSSTERMRITSNGHLLVGKTSESNIVTTDGTRINSTGGVFTTRSDNAPIISARQGSDGSLIEFFAQGDAEGSISVSGTSVSYNGAHLSRWSQLAGGAQRTEILRGSVLSNLDEMCEWGEEDNEQLNRMKVSDVEGDVNVSGVFQAWDDDDDTYINDFYCAMTGDFVIRIAQGTTVARGDLLMSAGDGTAKPQDDDIVRSKTIAKVTSTTVSTTYSDGSYCVPCVLMAC